MRFIVSLYQASRRVHPVVLTIVTGIMAMLAAASLIWVDGQALVWILSITGGIVSLLIFLQMPRNPRNRSY